MTRMRATRSKPCPRCGLRCGCALRVCACGHEFYPRKGSRARTVRLADGSTVIWKRKPDPERRP